MLLAYFIVKNRIFSCYISNVRQKLTDCSMFK